MGDAGSLFLGFTLAVLGIKLVVPTDPVIASFVPILVLGVAIFDTALVTLTRLARGRSPFEGGRDHVSHRLVALGIPVPFAVGLLYVAAVGLGWLGVIMARLTGPVTSYLLLGFTVVSLLMAGVLVARVQPPGGQIPTGVGQGERGGRERSRLLSSGSRRTRRPARG